mmetsp:Transcript_72170/g.182553  ORF Transcript_72170/g.182553 Transcript_72170/m.182553 type:complete len:689 (+) Transcript_72170:2-2068(+)
MTQYEDQAEAGVTDNCQQLEKVLKRRQVCHKLEVLFGLPATLTRCLDREAYDLAACAYNCCSGFLAQHKQMASFEAIFKDVEHQIALVRSALELRLRSKDLSVHVAVHDAGTLLSLDVRLPKVTQDYLSGRTAMLQETLEQCFSSAAKSGLAEPKGDGGGATGSDAGEDSDKPPSKHEQDILRPESVALSNVCSRAMLRYLPCLIDAVEGLQKIQEGHRSLADAVADDGAVSEFVSARLGGLFEQLLKLVGLKCPPTRVLVTCMHSLRNALQPLRSRLPRLLSKLFVQFMNDVANSAVEGLFAAAAALSVSDLARLHGECHSLDKSVMKEQGAEGQEQRGPCIDIMEDVARSEHALIMSGFTALTECQPLLALLETDAPGAERLVRKVHAQLGAFFLAIADICHVYVGQDPQEARQACYVPPDAPRLAFTEVARFARLEWRGLFGLILVRMARHFEVKVIGKVWGAARDMFAASPASADLVMPPAVVKATRCAAQAVITHYTLIGGHRLAAYFRDTLQGRNWVSMKEPRDSLFLSRVVREMHTWDAELAQVLGDPRKSRERRSLTLFKNAMELEMERMLAKKVQTFALTPFNRNGVEVGIFRIGFKALYELVREGTFGKFGLQQIQVEGALLSAFVQEFIDSDDSGALCSLLSEAVTSASQRCIDPVLMDKSMVEALRHAKEKEFKLQ